MAFTASITPKLLLGVNSIFKRPTVVNAEFESPVETAKLFLTQQETKWEPLLKGQVCQGATVWFHAAGVNTTVTPSTDCNIPTCNKLQTLSKDFSNATPLAATVCVDDKCDNESDFVTESAKALDKAFNDIRKQLNKNVLTLLTANVQPNQMTEFADYNLAAATAGGNRLKFSSGTWNWERLQVLNLLARRNGLNDFFILNGQNFYIDSEIAKLKNAVGCCDAAQARAYNSFNIHWDVNVLDSHLTRRSTFLVERGVCAFWNVTYSPFIPVSSGGTDNVWTFSMPDPFLQWNDGGTLKPVMYEIEYRKVCTGRQSGSDRLIYTHQWYVRLLHGLGIAPAGYNEAATPARVLTGILEIVQE